MAFLPTVSILHCGGDEEKRFIKYLEDSSNSQPAQGFVLEYRKYHGNQAKPVVMFNDAQKYKKEQVSLIVLISMNFFDIVWPTSYKQGILNVITAHSTKHCLHIWLDVKENNVKQRSTALHDRRDSYFRRIKASELTNLQPQKMLKRIHELISANGDGKFSPLNNYAVDYEVDEMRSIFQKQVLGGLPKPVEPAVKDIRRLSKKKSDPYIDALRFASMTPDEITAYTREISNHDELNSQSTHGSKKKKKKKKGVSNIKLFIDLADAEIGQVAFYLSKGPGANWRQLAESFDYDDRVIRDLIESVPVDTSRGDQSRCERFLNVLKVDKPGLEIQEFILKCRQITRTDVALYIESLLN